jgi:hypothetical protein
MSMTGPTRLTVASLLVAAVLVFVIPFMRDDEVGFGLVVGAVLLLAAAAAWRFGLPGHIFAGVVGLLLLLLFGFYTIANLTGVDEATVEYNQTVALVIDAVLAVAGAVALYGAIAYVLRNRRTRHHSAGV